MKYNIIVVYSIQALNRGANNESCEWRDVSTIEPYGLRDASFYSPPIIRLRDDLRFLYIHF